MIDSPDHAATVVFCFPPSGEPDLSQMTKKQRKKYLKQQKLAQRAAEAADNGVTLFFPFFFPHLHLARCRPVCLFPLPSNASKCLFATGCADDAADSDEIREKALEEERRLIALARREKRAAGKKKKGKIGTKHGDPGGGLPGWLHVMLSLEWLETAMGGWQSVVVPGIMPLLMHRTSALFIKHPPPSFLLKTANHPDLHAAEEGDPTKIKKSKPQPSLTPYKAFAAENQGMTNAEVTGALFFWPMD